MKVLVFPGQGSQAVGMGKAIYEASSVAREVFQEVNEALNQNLTKIMFDGDEQTLTLTENAQPAIMAVSIAVLRVLEKDGLDVAKKFSYVAGHSLGEYTALTAAKAFTLSDCAKLLKLRGQSMQNAVKSGDGAMSAILGLAYDKIESITKQVSKNGLICSIANDNSDGQVVISGHVQAVEAANVLAKEQGAKRALMLPVSAPFHCALMQPAANKMQEALEKATIAKPIIPVIANVTANANDNIEDIKTLLVEQVTGRVRWRESMNFMLEQGITHSVELGAGKVLTGMLKRLNSDIIALNAETPDDIEKLLGTL